MFLRSRRTSSYLQQESLICSILDPKSKSDHRIFIQYLCKAKTVITICTLLFTCKFHKKLYWQSDKNRVVEEYETYKTMQDAKKGMITGLLLSSK